MNELREGGASFKPGIRFGVLETEWLVAKMATLPDAPVTRYAAAIDD